MAAPGDAPARPLPVSATAAVAAGASTAPKPAADAAAVIMATTAATAGAAEAARSSAENCALAEFTVSWLRGMQRSQRSRCTDARWESSVRLAWPQIGSSEWDEGSATDSHRDAMDGSGDDGAEADIDDDVDRGASPPRHRRHRRSAGVVQDREARTNDRRHSDDSAVSAGAGIEGSALSNVVNSSADRDDGEESLGFQHMSANQILYVPKSKVPKLVGHFIMGDLLGEGSSLGCAAAVIAAAMPALLPSPPPSPHHHYRE